MKGGLSVKSKKSAQLAANPNSQGIMLRGVKEGALISLVVICIYLLMALTSYNHEDPGWSRTGIGSDVKNAGGAAGAWIADVCYSLFGYVSFLFPMMIAFRAWSVFHERDEKIRFDSVMLALRTLGFLFVIVSGTALATLYFSVEKAILPSSSGGILGVTISTMAMNAFNITGSTLILLALFLFGMTIFTDLSWFNVMDRIGALALARYRKTMTALIDKFSRIQDNKKLDEHNKKRQAAIIQQMEKQAKKDPILITKASTKPIESKRAVQERQGSLFEAKVTGELPQLSLLDQPNHEDKKGYTQEALEALSRLLEFKLKDFGIEAEVVSVLPGPVITRFEIQPAPGTKASRISGLSKDIARSLAVISVRVVEVIPGKSVVGIEIPNEHREMVLLSDVLSSALYDEAKSPLTLALGHDIEGQPVIADLAKMPHLLVAGTTGSGKSVGVNAMLLSLLYKSTPADVRMILVDPKMLELSVYEGIPHLLTPVITDMKEAANGLRWCVAEMERRYKLMAALGVRNLAGYNRKVKDAIAAGEPIEDPLWKPEEHYQPGEDVAKAPTLENLPCIVVVIDEFADMMMVVGKKVEELIARIAQKARAAGIHLLLATQRPSVDVITGLIKANIPTRIAFQVSSKIDSRTILDQGGAEQLLGHGDMLYLPPGSGLPVRVHGAFVSDNEVHRVVHDWKLRGQPNYLVGVVEEHAAGDGIPGLTSGEDDPEQDNLYDEAVAFVTETRKASISSVQRKLRIGYNRAARMIEAMENAGIVSEMGTNGSREVIAPPPPSMD